MLERCRRGGATWLAVTVVSVLGACADSNERPGMATDCNDPACLEARGNGIPLPIQSANGTGGSAGSGNTPSSGAGTLAGSVKALTTPDLENAQSLQGTVEVRAPNPTANADDIVSETGVGGMFRLDGVVQKAVLWVGVGAFDDPPAGIFMNTLQAVDSTRGNFVDLLVVRRDIMDQLAASFLSQTVVLDPDSAHVIVRFVHENGVPIEGVSITFPDPTKVSVAYDAGDSYSDALVSTSTRGMAVLLNLPASGFPGVPTSVYATVDGGTVVAPVQIVASAVTMVTAIIPDP